MITGRTDGYIEHMSDISGQVDDDRSQSLYRFWDAHDRLLYVGVSDSWARRLGQHRGDKSWFNEITTITLEPFPDRASVLAAERQAIEREKPLYNIRHNQGIAITVGAAVTVRLSQEDLARNVAGLGMLACAAVLAFRWLADVGSAWWMGRRLTGEGPVVELPKPRNPFTESPPPVALQLLGVFASVAANPSTIWDQAAHGDGPASPSQAPQVLRRTAGSVSAVTLAAVSAPSRT